MKKIFILFLMCFMLTACTTEVNLKIDSKNVYENIKIYDTKNKIYLNNILDEKVQSNIEFFEVEQEIYNVKEFEQNDIIGKIYETEQDINYWKSVSDVRQCYETFDFRKTSTHISLNTSDEYLCGYFYEAYNVKVVIESDLDLVNSNADKVEGNKLIWNINEDNYKNKSIQFSYKIADEDSIIKVNEKNSEEDNSDFIKYILISLGIISLIIGIVIYIKVKKSNK